MPVMLPQQRCALTAPFHPYLYSEQFGIHRRFVFCGTSQGFLLPAVNRHHALWSSDFPLDTYMPSDR